MNLCTYVTNLFRINLYWSTGLTVRFYISSTVRHNSFLRGYKKIIHYLLLYYIPFCGPGSSVGIATGYGLDGPGIESRWGARFSPPVQTGSPSLLYNGYRLFPGGKERPGRDADPSLLLVPWSRKGRAIPLLPLWAVRSVQSLSACTVVHFTLLKMTSG